MASEMPPDPFVDVSGSPPPSTANQKRSWSELRQAVKKTRRLATSVINRMPHSFTFRHITDNKTSKTCTRLYFLGVPPGTRENSLQFVDLPDTPLPDDQTLTWHALLEAFNASSGQCQFSKEEQLLRERKRLGSFGITSYDFLAQQGSFVFPASNSMFVATDGLQDHRLSNQPVIPLEVTSSSSGTCLDPKFCPSNDGLLAFISGSDIWAANIKTGHEKRLTHTHKGGCPVSDDPLSAGVPSFVMQEEFDRYTGYWWQPNTSENDDVYRILYEEVNESEVEVCHIVSSNGDEEYRYPRAGTANAKSTLKVVEFRIDTMGDIVDVTYKQLCTPLEFIFPSLEYIPRIGWFPDGQSMYAVILDRPQLSQKLIKIPLTYFTDCPPEDVEMMSLETTPSPDLYMLYDETSTVWINVHDILHFLPNENTSCLQFIWASEKSGFRHLYLVTVNLGQNNQVHIANNEENGELSGIRAGIVSEVPLTSGEWEVSSKQLWVDKKRKLVYFMGLQDTPLESHLYSTSYDKQTDAVRLTELGYSHAVEMDDNCEMFVTVFSNIGTPPSSAVYNIQHMEDGTAVPVMIGALIQRSSKSDDYNAPELFNYRSDAGHTMYGMYFKPLDLEPGQKCPTVLVVYGGPQVQMVTNAYKGHRFLRLHTLTALGYAVVVIDSRGSVHRGLHFESHIKHRLGTVEIADQVEGLTWIAAKMDFIDLNRVAIHGWSYGGYLSLMGLAQRPDIFKVAIAGAPVTSWTLYDTGYTERYMDTPQQNSYSYKTGSVLEYVEQLPSEGNRLLIVHGLIDENVHFFHSSKLINSLIKACKPYQLQVYPGERHGIRNPDASEHYETMVLSFLQQNL